MDRPQGDLSTPLTLNGEANAEMVSSMEFDSEHPRLVEPSSAAGSAGSAEDRKARARTHEEYAVAEAIFDQIDGSDEVPGLEQLNVLANGRPI